MKVLSSANGMSMTISSCSSSAIWYTKLSGQPSWNLSMYSTTFFLIVHYRQRVCLFDASANLPSHHSRMG